jgi:flagellin
MSVINTNIKSLVAQGALVKNNRELSVAMERLSTGSRINSAKDDAAGLAISTRMTSQTRGLSMAIRNANDGISLMQTSEGALDEVTGALQRMRELAVQAVNGTNNAADREALDAEVQQLKSEIDRIATTTEFNNQKILDGSFKNKTLQIGDKADQTISVSIGSVQTRDLGMGGSGGSTQAIVGTRSSVGVTGVATAIGAGDIEINGQALGDIAVGDDMEDIVANVNANVDNVKASAFNTVVMKNVGTGVLAAGELTLQVRSLGAGSTTTAAISASNSMAELVVNINNEMGSLVRASLNDQGKLVLENDSGSAIVVTDSSTGGGGTGIGSTSATTFNGFLKLESLDGSPVRVARGNLGMASPGTLDDLAVLGYREVTTEPTGENYTVTGLALTSAGVAGAWDRSDLTINGVQIYDQDVDTTSFAGKLNAINNFADETGVFASSYFSKSFSIPTGGFAAGNAVALNGVTIDTGANVAAFASNINAKTTEHGLVATVNGSNLVLSGSNVQKATVEYIDPASQVVLKSGVSGTANAATGARTVTIKSADVVVGRTLQLSIASTGGTGSVAVTYTMVAGDTKTSVAHGIREALLATKYGSSGSVKAAATPQFKGTSTATVVTTSSASALLKISAASYGIARMELKVVSTPSSTLGSYKTTVSSANGTPNTARSVTFKSADIEAGAVYELRIVNGNPDGTTGTSTTVRVTATDTSPTTLAAAFESALESSTGAFYGTTNTFNTNGLSSGAVSVSSGQLTIAQTAGYGRATILFTKVDAVLGGADTHFGAIRLDSKENTPIQIALGDTAVPAEHGFLEQNVGAADYQVNAPTLGGAFGESLTGLTVSTADSASKAINSLDAALDTVSAMRSNLGAIQNRLDRTIDNLSNVLANTEASRSRIADTDYAVETTNLAKAQIIQQAATAMLAQANQQPQSVLALLQ